MDTKETATNPVRSQLTTRIQFFFLFSRINLSREEKRNGAIPSAVIPLSLDMGKVGMCADEKGKHFDVVFV